MAQPLVVFGDADTSTVTHRIYAGKFDVSGWALGSKMN
jgi:hypothetical protein